MLLALVLAVIPPISTHVTHLLSSLRVCLTAGSNPRLCVSFCAEFACLSLCLDRFPSSFFYLPKRHAQIRSILQPRDSDLEAPHLEMVPMYHGFSCSFEGWVKCKEWISLQGLVKYNLTLSWSGNVISGFILLITKNCLFTKLIYSK